MALPIRWLIILGSLLFLNCAQGSQNTEKEKIEFSKKKISINKVLLIVEVAETSEQHGRGLMYREKLPENQGMIFIFPDSAFRSFWMKNTYIDLSIGFFDESKRLFQVLDMKASSVMQKDFSNYNSNSPAKYALEVPKGWFERNKVKVGDKFEWR